MSRKLPWGIKCAPRVVDTKSVLVDIEDHLGRSFVMIETWWSGEGFTLRVDDAKKEQSIELSWQEAEAFKLALKAIEDAEKGKVAK